MKPSLDVGPMIDAFLNQVKYWALINKFEFDL